MGTVPESRPSLASGTRRQDSGTWGLSPRPRILAFPELFPAGPGFGDCPQIPESPRPRILPGTRGQRGFGDCPQILAPAGTVLAGPGFGDSSGVPKSWPLLNSSGPGQDLGTVPKSSNPAVLGGGVGGGGLDTRCPVDNVSDTIFIIFHERFSHTNNERFRHTVPCRWCVRRNITYIS